MGRYLTGGIGVALICIAISGFLSKKPATTPAPADPVLHETPASPRPSQLPKRQAAAPAKPQRPPSETNDLVWKLDGFNFEDRVHRCFQGDACELVDDPVFLYRYFMSEGNRKACDLLISFLRKGLKDPEHAERYQYVVKAMINDFYPAEERQFQDAAYYNYLGDLDKSLELYLDLEEKAATDSTLRKAPKLNIANTYFDLGKPREALPYYEAALDRLYRREPRVPEEEDIIRFIERRIEAIEATL